MTEPSTRIVEAIADWKGVDTTALEQPLYDVVDTDAIDELLDAERPVQVTFEYDGLVVSVDSDDTVQISPTERPEQYPSFTE